MKEPDSCPNESDVKKLQCVNVESSTSSLQLTDSQFINILHKDYSKVNCNDLLVLLYRVLCLRKQSQSHETPWLLVVIDTETSSWPLLRQTMNFTFGVSLKSPRTILSPCHDCREFLKTQLRSSWKSNCEKLDSECCPSLGARMKTTEYTVSWVLFRREDKNETGSSLEETLDFPISRKRDVCAVSLWSVRIILHFQALIPTCATYTCWLITMSMWASIVSFMLMKTLTLYSLHTIFLI